MRPSAPPLDPDFHKPRVAIPPPPRVPEEYRHTDTLPAPPVSEAIVPASLDHDQDVLSGAVVLLDVHERRVRELQESGNRNLQEARDERASHARTRFLLDCAITQALNWKAALHRIDPAWRTT